MSAQRLHSSTLRPSRHRCGPAPLCVLLMVGVGLGGLTRQGAAQDSMPVLSPGRAIEGVIVTQRPHAYGLNLLAGQFLRLVGHGDAMMRLIGPRGDTIQLAHGFMLSQVVRETGQYRVELARWEGDTAAQRYELRVDELLSPGQYAARQDSLQNDPRVAWLAQHAIPLRSLAPDDNDFTDLRRLREAIGDARVVLLGEESHADATIIRANARLVRFLHQEMGFDVLAFESGLYEMWRVWQLIQAGQDPAAAMPQGLFGTWSRAAAFQPLANYIGQRAVSARPLEVAGVDFQLTGSLSRQHLIPELRELVARERLAEGSRDLGEGFWTPLSRFVEGRRDSLPARRVQEDVLSGLRCLAARLADAAESHPTAEGRRLRMWAQVSLSLTELMASTWSTARGETAAYDHRDRQMARNLAWLAREYFPGRKIIVWAANPHVLRHPNRLEIRRTPRPTPALCCGSGMGQEVWELFGDRSFVIAATAYSGQFRWLAWPQSFTVESDQDPSFELEELLAATGLEQAVLPLRSLPPGGDWLRNPSLSRLAWNYRTVLATWPDHADAVLFLRESTPRIRAPAGR